MDTNEKHYLYVYIYEYIYMNIYVFMYLCIDVYVKGHPVVSFICPSSD